MSKTEILEKSMEYVEAGVKHPGYIEWRDGLKEKYDMYKGDQWTREDEEIIRARGQVPVVVNFIKKHINSFLGDEILSRKRLRVILDNTNSEEGNVISDHLSMLLTDWYAREDVQRKFSLKYRDALIQGLGWSNIYMEEGLLRYDYVNPAEMIPDLYEGGHDLGGQRFVAREYKVSNAYLMSKYGNKASFLRGSPDSDHGRSMAFLPHNYHQFYNTQPAEGVSTCHEVQWKEWAVAYSGFTEEGMYFETFSKEKALANIKRKKDIKEIAREKIMRSVIVGDKLLEGSELKGIDPQRSYFSYVPFLLSHCEWSGTPLGELYSYIDIQRAYNFDHTEKKYADKKEVFVFHSQNPGADTRGIEQVLKESRGFISLRSGESLSKMDFRGDSAAALQNIMTTPNIIDMVSPISKAELGEKGNVTSGAAIRAQQKYASIGRTPAQDNVSAAKKREAMVALSAFCSSGDQNIESIIEKGDEKYNEGHRLLMNYVNPAGVIENDISWVGSVARIAFISVPDTDTNAELQRSLVLDLLANPNAQLLMQNPELLRLLGIDGSTSSKISSASPNTDNGNIGQRMGNMR